MQETMFGDIRASWPEDRFWANVAMVPIAGCWVWMAGVTNLGYGRFTVNGAITSAHRYSWELLRGPIPVGLEIDHLCRVRCCVNPQHLEPVTSQENSRRVIERGCLPYLSLKTPKKINGVRTRRLGAGDL